EADAAGDPCLYHYTAAASFNTGRYEAALKYWRLAEKHDPASDIPEFYISQLEHMKKGAQQPVVSYHYHLPFEESIREDDKAADPLQEYIKRDPLLRSSFLWALRHSDGQTKLQVIKAMGMTRDREMEMALREFILERTEDDYLKKVAIFVLRSMGVKEPLQA